MGKWKFLLPKKRTCEKKTLPQKYFVWKDSITCSPSLPYAFKKYITPKERCHHLYLPILDSSFEGNIPLYADIGQLHVILNPSLLIASYPK
jgi:hypothetical protein